MGTANSWIITSAGALTLNGLTASSLVATNASKTLVSVANGTGVLTNNGSGTLTWVPAGGGLVNFTESVNTEAPNATVPVVRLLATNAATNVDVALSPKGNGALTAQVADNGVAGGNKRGQYAVDWQMSRGSNTQVASGNYATVGGGNGNTANTPYATVGGGGFNTASVDLSTVGGGGNNTASGNYATVGGGFGNTASGDYSFVPGGYQAVASNHGQMAHSAGPFATSGDAQTSVFVLRNQTTDGTATSLFLNGISLRIGIPTNGAMTFKVTIVGKIAGNTAIRVGGWEIIGTITNNLGTATIMGVNILRTLNTPAGWGVPTVTGNGANMDIQVTGAALTTINWVARVETVEVVF